MRNLTIAILAVTGVGLSGCSQVSSIFKKKPHYHTADGTAVYVNDTQEALRTPPVQDYQFADQSYGGSYTLPSETVNASYRTTSAYQSSPYEGFGVELFNSQPSYNYTPIAPVDPRNAEFIMLNGDGNISDWQNCETLNRGYLYASEYNFSLNPEFEVCMRNKGYVLTTEHGPHSKQVLSAQTARLRSSFPTSSFQSSSYQSGSTVSSYPGYVR
jgi:uncharacterized protein YceK